MHDGLVYNNKHREQQQVYYYYYYYYRYSVLCFQKIKIKSKDEFTESMNHDQLRDKRTGKRTYVLDIFILRFIYGACTPGPSSWMEPPVT